MLTRKDIALLRAALKFFDEEMRPFNPRVLRHYFDRPADANLRSDAVDYLLFAPLGVATIERMSVALRLPSPTAAAPLAIHEPAIRFANQCDALATVHAWQCKAMGLPGRYSRLTGTVILGADRRTVPKFQYRNAP